MLIGLSIEPAGTTSTPSLACENGSAEPQVAQKHFTCCDPESSNILIFSSPDNQLIFAMVEKRLAECAEPLSLRQRPQ